MKKIKFLALMSIIGLVFVSCGSKSGQEESKMISANAVKLSGMHNNLLAVADDSVKIMLVKIADDSWSIRALVPIKNTMAWEDVPETDSNAPEYYIASMGNLEVQYLDENKSPVEFDVKPDWDAVKSVLASSSEKTEEMLIKEEYSWTAGDYKTVKEKYDKIAGIEFSKLELTKSHKASSSSSSGSSSSSSSSSDDDWDDIEKATKAANEMLKTAKALNDLYED